MILLRQTLLVSAGIAILFFCLPVFSQVSPADEQFKPYLQVKTVAGDERMVRVYFSPSCPYSKMYLQFFKNLAATLPESKVFAFTPLINAADGISYSASFVAIKRYYPNYIINYVEASLLGVQDRNLNTLKWADIDTIGRAAHIPVPVSRLTWQHLDEVKKDLLKLQDIQKKLEITNTPAVAVAGTYVVTPEFTQGDVPMYSQLVNGVISMAR
jgi:thiol-disulfide isomerase/thioredoxin